MGIGNNFFILITKKYLFCDVFLPIETQSNPKVKCVFSSNYNEAFHANRNVWKILIFDFLHFFVKKLFLVNFKIFLITDLKDIEIRLFAHNFLKNSSNSKVFFFLKFLFFYILFRKKIQKKLFKVFLYAIFECENFNFLFVIVGRYLCTLRFFW